MLRRRNERGKKKENGGLVAVFATARRELRRARLATRHYTTHARVSQLAVLISTA